MLHRTLICFFFLTLQDGNTGVVNAEKNIHTETEGGNITVGCIFLVPGSRMFFCKDECKEENILVETTTDRAQSGRYGIEYNKGPIISAIVFVSIKQLKKSDSGQYRCGLDRALFPDSFKEFELIVTEALLPSNFTPPSTTQNLSSSLGDFTVSFFSTETNTQPDTRSSARSAVTHFVETTGNPQGTRQGFFLVLVVCITVLVGVFLVVILWLHLKKTTYSDDLDMRRNVDHIKMECFTYENCPPGFTCEHFTYQSLDPATRNQDQIYSI